MIEHSLYTLEADGVTELGLLQLLTHREKGSRFPSYGTRRVATPSAIITNMDNAKRLATLNRIRKFSRLMDTAIRIPGTGFRFGLDPIIGLVPGAGDLISTGFSAYIIFLATRFGLPRQVVGKMLFNIALEAVVGTVPLVGDLFDAYYKSNIRNLALLEQHLIAVEPELEVTASTLPDYSEPLLPR